MSRERRKGLRDEERRLWEAVVADVSPLRLRRPSPSKPHAAPPEPVMTGLPIVERAQARLPSHAAPAPPKQQHAQPLSFDRRTRQKLLRGQVDIEAGLDLHGHSVTSAHTELEGFLRRCHRSGYRVVLVVTGKGGSEYVRHTLHSATHWHAPERQGQLRRHLPEWLESAGLREIVSGYQPAHPKHGGGGAWYVRLRRPNRP
jgi:DNA-nicking Smr family endonuclease